MDYYIKRVCEMKCDCCSHHFHDDTDRCARYNDSLCKFVYKFCKGKHFISKSDAISLWKLDRFCKENKRNKW